MSTDKKNSPLILNIKGKQIKQVNSFAYLGNKLSSTNNGAAAVKHRIGLGWGSLEKNKLLLTSKKYLRLLSRQKSTRHMSVLLFSMDQNVSNGQQSQNNKQKLFKINIARFMIKVTIYVSSSLVEVHIYITDVDDNPPKFLKLKYM